MMVIKINCIDLLLVNHEFNDKLCSLTMINCVAIVWISIIEYLDAFFLLPMLLIDHLELSN